MKSGWAKRKIMRSNPVFLSGYRADRKSSGIHDEICVRVFSFEIENEFVFFIIYDLIAVDELFSKKIQSMVADVFGDESKVIVSATHTHSAPVGTLNTSFGLLNNLSDVFGDWDEGYVDYIVQQTKYAINESVEMIEECIIKIVDDKVEQVASNRNNPSRFVDNRLFALEFKNRQGRRALLWHFSCHLTILGSDNTLISKDLTYGVEEYLPTYDVVAFMNGAAGDLSTRFTRKESSIKEIVKLARAISSKIESVLVKSNATNISMFNMTKHKIQLRTLLADSITVNKRSEVGIISQIDTSSYLLNQIDEGRKTHQRIIKNLENRLFYKFGIWHLQLNDYHFITFPGELYSSLLGLEAYDLNLRIIGYANGYALYLPDKSAFEENNYEALSSPFMKGEGERFIEIIKNLL